MDKAWQDVCKFHQKFGAPVGDTPRLLPPERVGTRVLWMREEIDEFIEAETIDEQADAMIDLIYFALGTLVEMGVRPQKLFDIVHTANMQKLWPDGTIRRDTDGKVIKSPQWRDPKPLLCAALQEQAKE